MDEEQDQEFNHLDKNEGIMNNPIEAPLVVRTKVNEFTGGVQSAEAANALLGS